MKRTPIRSSSILSVGYDPETRTLELEFSSLAVYAYFQVPPSIWAAFQASASKGLFHANYIVGKYEYKCVVPRPTQKESPNAADNEKTRKTRQVKEQVQARAAKNRIS